MVGKEPKIALPLLGLAGAMMFCGGGLANLQEGVEGAPVPRTRSVDQMDPLATNTPYPNYAPPVTSTPYPTPQTNSQPSNAQETGRGGRNSENQDPPVIRQVNELLAPLFGDNGSSQTQPNHQQDSTQPVPSSTATSAVVESAQSHSSPTVTPTAEICVFPSGAIRKVNEPEYGDGYKCIGLTKNGDAILVPNN